MTLHPSLFGSVDLPDFDDAAPAAAPPRRRPRRPPATAAAPGGTVVTIFETTGHVALRVTLSGGEVSVEATERPNVEIELVPLRDNDVTRQAIAEARVEMSGPRRRARGRRAATEEVRAS